MKPVIILTFANDKDKYLPMIVRESKNIFKSLQTHHDNGYVQVHREENTSVEDIFELFNRFRDRIAIFHYGGHAGGTHLQLETGTIPKDFTVPSATLPLKICLKVDRNIFIKNET